VKRVEDLIGKPTIFDELAGLTEPEQIGKVIEILYEGLIGKSAALLLNATEADAGTEKPTEDEADKPSD
jgi:hypothetical protein